VLGELQSALDERNRLEVDPVVVKEIEREHSELVMLCAITDGRGAEVRVAFAGQTSSEHHQCRRGSYHGRAALTCAGARLRG
jgi:hypothetical protein